MKMKQFLCSSVAALTAIAAFSTVHVAQAQEKLTVYSYRQPFLVEHLFDQFTAQSGIEVEVLYAKKGLIQRLKLEGDNSPADLLLSNNSLRLIEAKTEGLTKPIIRDAVAKVIPAALREKDNHWVGLTRRGRVLYANEDTVQPFSIQDYQDLASSDNDYRICLRPWRHAYNISLVAYLIEKIGLAETEKWVQAVQSKLGRDPQGNDRAQIRAVNAGECDIAIANSYYFGVMRADPNQIEDTFNVYSIFPTLNKVNGTFGFVSGVALLKSADNDENAGKLIDFMVSSEAQKVYSSKNHEFPASRLFTGLNADEANLDNGSLSDIFDHRVEALDLINRVIG